MIKEFGTILGGETAERTELFQVVVTPDEWNREPVEKQKGDGLSPG
jgi:hypothetical protein